MSISEVLTDHSRSICFTNEVEIIERPPEIINYKDEITLIFHNNMLDVIVDSWKPFMESDVESIPSGYNIIISKPYHQIQEEDFSNASVTSIEGSNINFIKSNFTIKTENEKSITNSVDLLERASIKKFKSVKNIMKSRSSLKSKKLKKRTSIKKSMSMTKDPSKIIHEESNELAKEYLTFIPLEVQDEEVSIKFRNGNLYEGQVSKKLMHGTGTYTWANGTIYTGEFVHGIIQGFGYMKYSDLSWYEGEFYNGFRHGKGTMFVAETGIIYNGSWRYGQKHGTGWILYEPGNWYSGNWKNGFKNGYGLRQYLSGSRYVGYWKDDRPHGTGCMVWKNNDVGGSWGTHNYHIKITPNLQLQYYNGEWVDGEKCGYGEYSWNKFLNKTFSFPPENKYKGAWLNGCMQGVGHMDFGMDGGARLAGRWDKNKKHGAGLLICENGKIIQANPLFLDDKPIYSDTPYQDDFIESVQQNNSPIESVIHEEMRALESAISEQSVINISENKSSTLRMINEQIESRQSLDDLNQNILENIEKCKERFPAVKSNHQMLELPIQIPDEQIPLNEHINKVILRYQCHRLELENTTKKNSEVSDGSSFGLNNIRSNVLTNDTPVLFKSDEETIFTKSCSWMSLTDMQLNEEKTLYNVIKLHLSNLRSIYKQYATIGCLKTVPFKPVMIRMFLWQLYRDCRIPEKGFSMVQIDEILAENADSAVCSVHNPFEKIYFWQFLHSLISMSWILYGEINILNVNDGILKNAFCQFLNNDIYPNHGHHTGSVIFEYRDLFSMQSAYEWYKNEFGEPHTARKFLNKLCGTKSDNYNLNMPIEVQSGINIAPHDAAYLPDEYLKSNWETNDIELTENNPYYFYQCAYKLLGARGILKNLCSFCSNIINEELIVNIDYPIVFIEFYETILLCAQEIVCLHRERINKYSVSIQMTEENVQIREKSKDSVSTARLSHRKSILKEKRKKTISNIKIK